MAGTVTDVGAGRSFTDGAVNSLLASPSPLPSYIAQASQSSALETAEPIDVESDLEAKETSVAAVAAREPRRRTLAENMQCQEASIAEALKQAKAFAGMQKRSLARKNSQKGTKGSHTGPCPPTGPADVPTQDQFGPYLQYSHSVRRTCDYVDLATAQLIALGMHCASKCLGWL